MPLKAKSEHPDRTGSEVFGRLAWRLEDQSNTDGSLPRVAAQQETAWQEKDATNVSSKSLPEQQSQKEAFNASWEILPTSAAVFSVYGYFGEALPKTMAWFQLLHTPNTQTHTVGTLDFRSTLRTKVLQLLLRPATDFLRTLV